jgi:hypothetical protein
MCKDKCDLGIPNDDHAPAEMRKLWLLDLCQKYADTYLGFDNVNALVDQVVQDNTKSDGFTCRADDCQAKYVYHSRRVKYNQ